MDYPYFYTSSNIKEIDDLFEEELDFIISNIIPQFQLQLLQEFDDLENLANIIKEKFEELVIIGMGGAVNAYAMIHRLGKNPALKVHVIDTPDSFKNETIRKSVNLNKTAFLIISKSGNTIETLFILKYWLAEILKEKLPPSDFFYFILGTAMSSSLKEIALAYNCKILPHIDFSGRFSVFSNITIFPALVCDINIKNFFYGAQDALDDLKNNKDKSLITHSAKDILSLYFQNIRNHVLLSYTSKLIGFLNWQCQIIAESLGKRNHGITPILNLGPQSQHSMFQIYLDGPKDKFFTFFIEKNHSNDQLSKLLNIQSQESYEIFKKQKIPVRKIEIGNLNEYSLGFLAMHMILEIAIIGAKMKINIFDQPQIEAMKAQISSVISDTFKNSFGHKI